MTAYAALALALAAAGLGLLAAWVAGVAIAQRLHLTPPRRAVDTAVITTAGVMLLAGLLLAGLSVA